MRKRSLLEANAPVSDELLVPSTYIRAVRDSGYSSLATALAELIDNSIQASASRIQVVVTRSRPGEDPEITVEDNGRGMSPSELQLCLKFGGSTRFDNRERFGRFGMGLPAASLSQARRVEVTSWQSGGREYSVNLDVNAVASGEKPSFKALAGPPSGSKSGSRVRWTGCDRIEYQRLGWLERSLRRDLGRIYRQFLSAGLEITINGSEVAPADWLLLDTVVEGATAESAFDPLVFPLDAGGVVANVIARFTLLPIHRWHRLDNRRKREMGIVGGGGVSVLRAGREIARGWHLMGAKRKENYDDWWRCEVAFEPVLDEYFGITINKQGIRPSVALSKVIEPQLEAASRLLNARVRRAFEDVKFRSGAEASCRIASQVDLDLPPLVGSRRLVPLDYSISAEPLGVDSMFEWEARDEALKVVLNQDHSAFHALYQPLRSMESGTGSELRTAIELMILAFVRSAAQMGQPAFSAELLATWSKTYGRMLQAS